ncbi:MAG: hypothetical protein H6729_03665 [Deltaproteobacteria bacterium]|nr:hypothetical protein [Deltaproteobacteria bacterium]
MKKINTGILGLFLMLLGIAFAGCGGTVDDDVGQDTDNAWWSNGIYRGESHASGDCFYRGRWVTNNTGVTLYERESGSCRGAVTTCRDGQMLLMLNYKYYYCR